MSILDSNSTEVSLCTGEAKDTEAGIKLLQDDAESTEPVLSPDPDNPTKDDNKKLFVGGLSQETTDQDLIDYFSKFGPVAEANIKICKETNVPRGFGFVLFEDDSSVTKVLEHKEHRLLDRKIDPKLAKPTRDSHRKVYVGGVDPEVTREQIVEYFQRYGTVESVDLPKDASTGKRRVFAFVMFRTEMEARSAAVQQRQELCGKSVEVRLAFGQQNKFRTMGLQQQTSRNTLGVLSAHHHHHPHHHHHQQQQHASNNLMHQHQSQYEAAVSLLKHQQYMNLLSRFAQVNVNAVAAAAAAHNINRAAATQLTATAPVPANSFPFQLVANEHHQQQQQNDMVAAAAAAAHHQQQQLTQQGFLAGAMQQAVPLYNHQTAAAPTAAYSAAAMLTPGQAFAASTNQQQQQLYTPVEYAQAAAGYNDSTGQLRMINPGYLQQPQQQQQQQQAQSYGATATATYGNFTATPFAAGGYALYDSGAQGNGVQQAQQSQQQQQTGLLYQQQQQTGLQFAGTAASPKAGQQQFYGGQMTMVRATAAGLQQFYPAYLQAPQIIKPQATFYNYPQQQQQQPMAASHHYYRGYGTGDKGVGGGTNKPSPLNGTGGTGAEELPNSNAAS